MFVKSSEGIPGSQPTSHQAQEEEGEKEKPPLNGALQGPAPLQEDTTGNQTYYIFCGISVFSLRFLYNPWTSVLDPITDPDPAFQVNSDTDRTQGFDDQKFNKIQLKFF